MKASTIYNIVILAVISLFVFPAAFATARGRYVTGSQNTQLTRQSLDQKVRTLGLGIENEANTVTIPTSAGVLASEGNSVGSTVDVAAMMGDLVADDDETNKKIWKCPRPIAEGTACGGINWCTQYINKFSENEKDWQAYCGLQLSDLNSNKSNVLEQVVREIQIVLEYKNYQVNSTIAGMKFPNTYGIFNEQIRRALHQFQNDLKIQNTGEITKRALNKISDIRDQILKSKNLILSNVANKYNSTNSIRFDENNILNLLQSKPIRIESIKFTEIIPEEIVEENVWNFNGRDTCKVIIQKDGTLSAFDGAVIELISFINSGSGNPAVIFVKNEPFIITKKTFGKFEIIQALF